MAEKIFRNEFTDTLSYIGDDGMRHSISPSVHREIAKMSKEQVALSLGGRWSDRDGVLFFSEGTYKSINIIEARELVLEQYVENALRGKLLNEQERKHREKEACKIQISEAAPKNQNPQALSRMRDEMEKTTDRYLESEILAFLAKEFSKGVNVYIESMDSFRKHGLKHAVKVIHLAFVGLSGDDKDEILPEYEELKKLSESRVNNGMEGRLRLSLFHVVLNKVAMKYRLYRETIRGISEARLCFWADFLEGIRSYIHSAYNGDDRRMDIAFLRECTRQAHNKARPLLEAIGRY